MRWLIDGNCVTLQTIVYDVEISFICGDFLKMDKLNLPSFQFRVKKQEHRMMIFDEIRRKFVTLTPEEWVRQNFIKYLCQHLGYPQQLMAIEKSVNVNGIQQRADIVIYSRRGSPVMIIECKASHVSISNEVFAQAARYNMKLKVDYLILTNGLKHYGAKLDYANETYNLLSELPAFNNIQ